MFLFYKIVHILIRFWRFLAKFFVCTLSLLTIKSLLCSIGVFGFGLMPLFKFFKLYFCFAIELFSLLTETVRWLCNILKTRLLNNKKFMFLLQFFSFCFLISYRFGLIFQKLRIGFFNSICQPLKRLVFGRAPLFNSFYLLIT